MPRKISQIFFSNLTNFAPDSQIGNISLWHVCNDFIDQIEQGILNMLLPNLLNTLVDLLNRLYSDSTSR